jgi:hypothetical protein
MEEYQEQEIERQIEYLETQIEKILHWEEIGEADPHDDERLVELRSELDYYRSLQC